MTEPLPAAAAYTATAALLTMTSGPDTVLVLRSAVRAGRERHHLVAQHLRIDGPSGHGRPGADVSRALGVVRGRARWTIVATR